VGNQILGLVKKQIHEKKNTLLKQQNAESRRCRTQLHGSLGFCLLVGVGFIVSIFILFFN